MKILIASDDHALCERVRTLLVQQQIECPAGHVVSVDSAADRAGRIQPDLAILALPSRAEEALEALRQMRLVTPLAHTLVFGPVVDPKLILETLKQGADEFLDRNDLDAGLVDALFRFRNRDARPAARSPTGRVISLLAPSGGSGASTLAASLSVVLAQAHGGCGLLDLRLGVGDLAPMFDLKPLRTLADLCDNVGRLDQCLFEQFLLMHASGVQLLAAPTVAADVRRVTGKGVQRALALARARFPHVVLDLGCAFTDGQVEALWQTDVILLVLRLDYTSIRNTRRIMDAIAGLGIDRARIRLVANGYRQRRQLELEQAEAAVGMEIAHRVPHDPAAVNSAINAGVPVVLQSRFSGITRNIRALAHSVDGADRGRSRGFQPNAFAADSEVSMTKTPAPVAARVDSPAIRTRGGPFALDLIERALVLGLYAWLVQRVLANWASGGSPANLLLLLSEGLVILLMLCRRSTAEVSPHVGDWLLAWGATVAPLLVEPGCLWPPPIAALGAAVMLMGTLLQVHAKLVLGRSLGLVPAHRGLTFSGPYRFVRHPMYAGYLLSHLAFCAMNFTAWNLLMYALCYALQLPRLQREERWLRGDPRYEQYMASVPHRLIPGVY